MINYKCTLSYDGTNYQGWQVQPGGRPTIQGSLIECAEKIFDSKNIKVIGSGRTDTGVHALAQVVKLTTPKEIPIDNLQKGLNSLLPTDIKIQKIEPCEEDFHPVYSASKKRYDYRFVLGHDSCPPHLRHMLATHPHKFDITLAQKVCDAFVGEHNFKNFMNTGTPVNSTVREIFKCELKYVDTDQFWRPFLPGYWLFSVEGNGFLKQMVRLMVGALFSVAREHCPYEHFIESLEAKTDLKIGPVAPAHGLYLVEVVY